MTPPSFATLALLLTAIAIGPLLNAQIRLEWNDNSDNEDGFAIERSSDGRHFEQVAQVGKNRTSYVDKNPGSGYDYYYRVRAFNHFGFSGYTNTVKGLLLSANSARAGSKAPARPPLAQGANSAVIGEMRHEGIHQSISQSNAFYLAASGLGYEAVHDALRFSHHQAQGDLRLVMRIHSLTTDGSLARAGLMIRQSLATNSQHASVAVNGKGKFEALWRARKGARVQTFEKGTAAKAPYLAIEKRGGRITLSSSNDGKRWTTLKAVEIDLSGGFLVGPAIGSQRDGFMSVAKLEIIENSLQARPAEIVTETLGNLATRIVGPQTRSGSYRYRSDLGTHFLSASGKGFQTRSDELRYAYVEAEGNCQITIRLHDFQPGGSFARTGIMLRSSLKPNAAFAAVTIDGRGQANALTRPRDGQATRIDNAPATASEPYLRIRRIGKVCFFDWSTDGLRWIPIAERAVALGETFLAGLSLGAHRIGATSTSALEIVESTVPLLEPSLAFQNETFAQSRIRLRDSESEYAFDAGSNLHLLSAKGNGFEHGNDELNFAHWTSEGSSRIVAKVHDFAGDGALARAGLMLRDNLAPNAALAAVTLTGDGYVQALWRSAKGRALTIRKGPRVGAAAYLALERRGNALSFLWSRDGADWRLLSRTTFRLRPKSLVGLTVGSEKKHRLSSTAIEMIGLY